ncbi:hypothetical protein PMIN07_012610 [Paraphaeosphaeria minitans]
MVYLPRLGSSCTRPTPTSTRRISTNMDPIDKAITAILSREPGEPFTYQDIATKYGVNRSTLSRRYRRVTQSREEGYAKQRNLSDQQEIELLQYIGRLTEQGLPPTRQMIQSFASTIARKAVSIAWVDRFIQRNTNALISRRTVGIDSNRHNADSLIFDQRQPTESNSRESSASVLSNSDWGKFDRLLDAAINTGGGEEARKLSRTVHRVITQKLLLEQENQGLRDALSIKKNRLKRGRPLPLDQPDEDHTGGGAVFRSPHSVQRARDRQHQKDIAEQQLQLQKSEQAEARQANKALKARLLQERRAARRAAQDARAKQRANQATQRHLNQQAREARKQLQDSTKAARIGNTKASKQPHGEAVQVDRVAPTVSAVQSRRGRVIKTPSRYR